MPKWRASRKPQWSMQITFIEPIACIGRLRNGISINGIYNFYYHWA